MITRVLSHLMLIPLSKRACVYLVVQVNLSGNTCSGHQLSYQVSGWVSGRVSGQVSADPWPDDQSHMSLVGLTSGESKYTI